jgi:DNA-directed RNA polymerase sigma subunit (sigma70/sigma32)
MSSKKDHELIHEWQKKRNYQAYQMLKTRNRSCVMMFVNKYAASGVPRKTLESEAWKLFDDAVQNYNPNKGANFNTHLNYQLRKIDRYVKKYQNVARIPENLSSRIGEYDRVRSDLSNRFKRQPTQKEIASEMKWSLSSVKNLEKARRDDLFEGGFEGTGFDVSGTELSSNVVIQEIREELTAQERKVFDHLVGYKARKFKSKQKLAQKLGMSGGRLSQITRQIAIKIRPHLSGRYGIGISGLKL